MKSVKFWPQSERPRERLLEQGASALSDADLIALLLRNGLPGQDVVAFSRDLLAKYGGLRGLLYSNRSELEQVKGLGKAKVASLLAVSELAKRSLREEVIGKNYVKAPDSVLAYLMSSMADQKKEVFKVLFLNKSNRILNEKDLFEGTIDETLVHPREVIQAVLQYHATAIVLVHNHPSGAIYPSQADINITERIHQACSTIAVKVLDHIIVGDREYFSFKERGLLS